MGWVFPGGGMSKFLPGVCVCGGGGLALIPQQGKPCSKEEETKFTKLCRQQRHHTNLSFGFSVLSDSFFPHSSARK